MSSPSGVGNLNQRPIQIVAGVVVVVVDFLKNFCFKIASPADAVEVRIPGWLDMSAFLLSARGENCFDRILSTSR